jgi:hypothetical protein
MYNPFFTKLQEFTIDDFRGQMSSFTKRFRKERDRIRGVESRVAIVANVKKKGDDLTIYFLTLPTHTDRSNEVPDVKSYPPSFKSTSAYTIVILVKDFFKWKTKPISEMKVSDLKEIFKVADVKFHNTSPAFFLQGYAYNLTQIDSSIKKVTTPAKVWGPRTSNSIIDKHIGGILSGFDRFLPEILKQLKMKVKRSKSYQQ